MSETQVQPYRTYFWRRAVAVAIDFWLVGLVVGLIGVGLSLLTGGSVRISEPGVSVVDSIPVIPAIDTTACEPLTKTYPEIKIPADFKVTEASRCVQRFFGVEYDWFLSFDEKTRDGYYTFERSITVPLDSAGNVTRAFYLDGLTYFLIVAYIFCAEARNRQTLGKRITGLRVQSLGGGAPDALQVIKRLIRYLPLLLVAVVFFVMTADEAVSTTYEFRLSLIRFSMYVVGLSAVLFAVIAVNFLFAVWRSRLPMYDRWAGTEVVHNNASPAAPQTTPA